ncbi:MAG TPA: 3-dehydroquinate synthase [Flavipsychrobacter sp.]|nr:3-dehydroquinate synthase [Flavipsychrobacter sp.]
MLRTIHFPSGTTHYYSGSAPVHLREITQNRKVVFITDENLYRHYRSFFEQQKLVVIPAGEEYKNWETAKKIVDELIAQEVDRTYLVIGVGGGMITDLTGFVSAIYMRGLDTAFFPTSLLSMVDAAVGGKNGVNIGLFKNLAGTIRQPEFIFYDARFLQTLSDAEWSNGFAEIIKYGCIFDKSILEELASHDISFYRNNSQSLELLIDKCVSLKNKTVLEDEHEKNIRKLLNFGHTTGHAIENQYRLAHGHAVAIGMMIACKLSQETMRLPETATETVRTLLINYGLPASFHYQTKDVMQLLKADKKRSEAMIDFIVLTTLGKAQIRKTSFEEIEAVLSRFSENA